VLLQLQLLGVLLPQLHLGVQLHLQLRRGRQRKVVQHQPMTRVKKHLQRQRVWLRQLLMRRLPINMHLLRLQRKDQDQIAQRR
jgi:hypothetical protein